MHISEGILTTEILIAGAALTAIGVSVGLKLIKLEKAPSIGIFSAAFFVASLIHIPIGFASIHLTLNGMLGLFLGWKAFPAILVGLFLQALMFQFGGFTTLGVNTFNMAFSGIVCFYLFGWGIKLRAKRAVFVGAAFLCGFFSALFSGFLVGFSLYLNGEAFIPAARVVVAAHFPVMIIEGVVTAGAAIFLKKVKPELLERGF